MREGHKIFRLNSLTLLHTYFHLYFDIPRTPYNEDENYLIRLIDCR